MYPLYPYTPIINEYSSFPVQPFPYGGVPVPIYGYESNDYDDWYSVNDYDGWYRQQPIRGQASWTDGGKITKCGIPWSRNRYMTAAVGTNSPYKCGQSLKIRNLSTPGGREIIVTVVDQVAGYPPNRINLHRRAFEALGVNPSLGVINIEIIPSPELEQEKWGKYLLEVTQTAYPGYSIIDYRSVGKQQLSAQQIKETFEFILQSPRERLRVRADVMYNPITDRVTSFNLQEV